MLVHKTQDKAAEGAETLKFFGWGFKNGADAVNSLDYIPLPASVTAEIEKQWKANVKDASGKAVAE